MSWFTRLKEGIQTATKNKKETPDGIWYKCKKCKEASAMQDLKKSYYCCPKCSFHTAIGSEEYFQILYDDGNFDTMFDDLFSTDMLKFVDLKPYKDRLIDAHAKTGLSDAMRVAEGKVHGKRLVTAAMDFRFIGGSMGSVMGEKISLAIDRSLETRTPLMIISKSGGARMMEAAFSLMQMAKTSAKLTLMAKAGIPYFSLMTDPTTGGVTASFAMLGDINFAEPEALIGFAGPRVIKETIKKDLPEGFQTSEYLLEHGFLDFITERKNLKDKVGEMLSYFN